MYRALLTRPRAQSEALARELADRGWAADIWPLMDIQYTLSAPPDWDAAQAFLFTSANAVRAISHLQRPTVAAYCVGSATAKAARKSGFDPIENAAGDAAALAALISAKLQNDTGPLVHIRGEDVTGDLPAQLTTAGFTVQEVIAYKAAETGAPPPDVEAALHSGDYHAVAFFSPRTSRLFASKLEMGPGSDLAKTVAIAISTAAAVPLEKAGFRDIIVANAPNALSMRTAICSVANG